MHTLVMDLEPGYIGTEPGFLYRFNRDLWQTITSSHLTLNTRPGRIKNFKLSGVTRQVETPTPDTPQDIQGVGVRTKNLLNEKRMLDFILQKPGASIVQFDGRRCLKLDGAFSYPNFNLYEGFEPDKRYTLTYDGFYESYKGEANAGNGFVFRLQDGKHNYALAEASDIGIWKHKTVTTATGVEKIYITYGVISVVYIDLDTLQLEEGTTSTPFEPYGYRTDVVTRTEQLFGNVEYSSGTYDPLTGTLMQKDTSNTVQSQAKVSLRLNGTPVKHILVSNVLGYNSCTFIKDETFDSIRVSFNGNVKDTTADSTVKMIDGEQYTLSFNFISNELNAGVISNIMLNKGSTATPYQPYAYYTAPIYTREPLTQWDHIEYWNGEYGVVKKSAVVVEDGSRNVDDTHYPILFFSTLAKPMNVDAKVYCNYCSSERIGRLSILGKNICINSADTYWGFANAPECKAWLTQKNAEGKPLYYCYETAEESWEPLPAISQQALRNLPTYKGTTIIDTTDPLQPEITVSYRAAKKNFFNPEKVFNSPVEATGYYKFDLGLSPGNYRWSIQKNEFLGSGQSVLITDALDYYGSNYIEGKTYNWVGHDTLTKFCFTSGIFTVKDVMYIASAFKTDMEAVKQLLKTLIIEKV